MKKLVSILNACCLAVLLLSNLFHMQSVTETSNIDMESVAGIPDTEETKPPAEETSVVMEEQELNPHTTGLLALWTKCTYYIRSSTDLHWQHAEIPLLPPERKP